MADNWWLIVILVIAGFYACMTVDTFLTAYLFSKKGIEGLDWPFRWFHLLLHDIDLDRVPTDIAAGLSGLFTGVILPHTSKDSLRTRPVAALAVWVLCLFILAAALLNIVLIPPDARDSTIPGHPVQALISMNKSALYFGMTLLGSLIGFRLIGK